MSFPIHGLKDFSSEDPYKSQAPTKSVLNTPENQIKSSKDYYDMLLKFAEFQKSDATIKLNKAYAKGGNPVSAVLPIQVLQPQLSELDERIMAGVVKMNADPELYNEMKREYAPITDIVELARQIAISYMEDTKRRATHKKLFELNAEATVANRVFTMDLDSVDAKLNAKALKVDADRAKVAAQLIA